MPLCKQGDHVLRFHMRYRFHKAASNDRFGSKFFRDAHMRESIA